MRALHGKRQSVWVEERGPAVHGWPKPLVAGSYLGRYQAEGSGRELGDEMVTEGWHHHTALAVLRYSSVVSP